MPGDFGYSRFRFPFSILKTGRLAVLPFLAWSILICVLLCLPAACSPWPVAGLSSLAFSLAAPRAQQKIELTLSAAISLKEALDEIARAFAAANIGATIHTNYGASGTLQLQIEQGAPVDIYISASPRQMDALAAKGLLLAGTRRDLLGNEVVLIVPQNSGEKISSFQDLARPVVRHVALGEPATVPAGQYAKEVLTHFGMYDAVRAKAILAKDVRQVLTYVETGNVDAGIVYKTDALSSARVKIVATAPEGSHAPVVYPVAIIKDTRNPAAAKQFLAFLSSPQAGSLLRQFGFTQIADK
jgi:molybdate transport system substrate-binding protein